MLLAVVQYFRNSSFIKLNLSGPYVDMQSLNAWKRHFFSDVQITKVDAVQICTGKWKILCFSKRFLCKKLIQTCVSGSFMHLLLYRRNTRGFYLWLAQNAIHFLLFLLHFLQLLILSASCFLALKLRTVCKWLHWVASLIEDPPSANTHTYTHRYPFRPLN